MGCWGNCGDAGGLAIVPLLVPRVPGYRLTGAQLAILCLNFAQLSDPFSRAITQLSLLQSEPPIRREIGSDALARMSVAGFEVTVQALCLGAEDIEGIACAIGHEDLPSLSLMADADGLKRGSSHLYCRWRAFPRTRGVPRTHYGWFSSLTTLPLHFEIWPPKVLVAGITS